MQKQYRIKIIALLPWLFYIFVSLIFFQCVQTDATISEKKGANKSELSFQLIPKDVSGITFTNVVGDGEDANYFFYPYYYNGGGVAVGDLNNDGLPDIVFTGNLRENIIYKNLGKLQFTDVSSLSGIRLEHKGWHTGVTMFDVNNDGLLDIYICRSGWFQDPASRTNLLFVNQGEFKFKEQAEEFSLADPGYSVQAYPLDYDRDGDLDLYLVNHRVDFINNSVPNPKIDFDYSLYSSDKLFNNAGSGQFTEVSEKSGIINNSWGLSASIGDFNDDGWPDIFVANDFQQPDQLYINQKNGNFVESIADYFDHTSFYSMGSDYNDINNDGYNDLVVLDMTPEDHQRSKRLMRSMDPELFHYMNLNGYHYQYMINTLQLNRGNGVYSEIAQLAGIDKTDWSWAPILADFDNDGYKDLFVSNGLAKDVTDNDFTIELNKKLSEEGQVHVKDILGRMPDSKQPNYLFKNNGRLIFENKKIFDKRGLDYNTNGASVADLDQDGDLDMILNNMNETSVIMENKSDTQNENNFLRINLRGNSKNVFGIGAGVIVFKGKHRLVQWNYASRGYQSSIEPLIHFGLMDSLTIDSIHVVWYDNTISKIYDVKTNQIIQISYDGHLRTQNLEETNDQSLFVKLDMISGLDYIHKENEYNDFLPETLLPHRLSEASPAFAMADIDLNGLEDIYITGSAGYSGVLYLQMEPEKFMKSENQPWANKINGEEEDACFFYANDDEFPDLYLAHGGYEYPDQHEELQDRLFMNDGQGKFREELYLLPDMYTSTSKVIPLDYDNDGDEDLLVCGKVIRGKYPHSPRSWILSNEQGLFIDVTDKHGLDLRNPGMVTDGISTDFDLDGDIDVILVGEWMPISVFRNDSSVLHSISSQLGLMQSHGWWRSICEGDWNGDGYPDYALGNTGKNNKYHPRNEAPLHLYAADFDGNKTNDVFLVKEIDAIQFLVRGKECASAQLPDIKYNFPDFNSFAEANASMVLGAEKLQNAYYAKAETFESSVLYGLHTGQAQLQSLPIEAQFSAIQDMLSSDFDKDQIEDLLIVGNDYGAEPETVRYDGMKGLFLKGRGDGNFTSVPVKDSGFLVKGNSRFITQLGLGTKGKRVVLIGLNDGPLQFFEY